MTSPSNGDVGSIRETPAGWTCVRIGDVVNPMEAANPVDSGPGEFDYVDIRAVDNVAYRITAPKRLPRAAPPSRARHVIRRDDVIISLVRPRLKNIAVVPLELDLQWASTAFCVCRPTAAIAPRYLYYLFLQDEFVQAIRTYGDSPPSGHDDDLMATAIPLAPLNEQLRIADRIDELFTDIAAGVAALERVRRNLKRYRAAVLHAAVTGRLTAAWRAQHGPAAEPGPKLLERILTERRRQWEHRTLAKYAKEGRKPPTGWQEQYREPAPPSPQGMSRLPDNWCWATNHQVVGTITSGSRDWSPYYDKGSGTFIMAQNVRMGRLDRTYRQAVDPPPNHRDRGRSQVKENDLLVTIVGANTGDVCRVNETLSEHYICQSVALMRPVLGDTSEWLLNWFVAPTGAQAQFKTFIYGAGRPHLGFDHLEQVLVAVPPVSEQKAIAEAVQEKLSQIDGLEAEVDRGLARAARLRQAILKAAFEGKLVPQDPNDEPATALLARLKNDQTTAASVSASSNGKARGTGRKRPARKSRAQNNRQATATSDTSSQTNRPKRARRTNKR